MHETAQRGDMLHVHSTVQLLSNPELSAWGTVVSVVNQGKQAASRLPSRESTVGTQTVNHANRACN